MAAELPAGRATPATAKLSASGDYLRFPGVAVVWHLQGTCPLGPLEPSLPRMEWISLSGRLNDLLEPLFVALPAHSYHVTMLDVLTMFKALGGNGTTEEWDSYLQERSPRLARAVALLAHEPFVPTLRLKEVQVHANVIGAELELEPIEWTRSTALEAALVDALGLDAGRRWPFHLTFAYRRPGEPGELSAQARRDVAAAVAACIGSEPIPLGTPTLCAFDDMTLFPPWRAQPDGACDPSCSLDGVAKFSGSDKTSFPAPAAARQGPSTGADLLHRIASIIRHVFDIEEAVEEAVDADRIGGVFGVELHRDAGIRNPHFEVYKWTGAGILESLEVRSPTNGGPRTGGRARGLVVLGIRDGALTEAEASTLHLATKQPGPRSIPRPPAATRQPPATPPQLRYDTYRREGGEVRLGYAPLSGCAWSPL